MATILLRIKQTWKIKSIYFINSSIDHFFSLEKRLNINIYIQYFQEWLVNFNEMFFKKCVWHYSLYNYNTIWSPWIREIVMTLTTVTTTYIVSTMYVVITTYIVVSLLVCNSSSNGRLNPYYTHSSILLHTPLGM